jgi:hypothetical protein
MIEQVSPWTLKLPPADKMESYAADTMNLMDFEILGVMVNFWISVIFFSSNFSFVLSSHTIVRERILLNYLSGGWKAICVI